MSDAPERSDKGLAALNTQAKAISRLLARLSEAEEALRGLVGEAGAPVCDCGLEHQGYWIPKNVYRRARHTLERLEASDGDR